NLSEDLKPLFDVVLDQEGKRIQGGGSGNLFAVVADKAGHLFLRINNSPPKRMYLTNPVNTWDDTGWYFEIEKLRGHGDRKMQSQIRDSLLAELRKRETSVPKVPWHQTYRADRG